MKNPAMNEALEQSQSNCAALSAALNNAITVSIACQLANTARSYAKGQRLWNEFCAERQFDDGVLVSEEKLVLWLQDVVLQLCYSPSKKQKGDAMTPAVHRKKRRKLDRSDRLADDLEVKQLAKSLEMLLEELLEELPAMLANDKAVEVGKGCTREGDGEDLDRS